MANSAVALRCLSHTSLRLPLNCCHPYPLSGPSKPLSAHLIRRCRSLRFKASSNMVKAIVVHEYGGPEVMKWEDVDVGELKEGEIRIKNKAVGLNFIDVYNRKGIYKAPLPFILGREAVGEVTAVGPGLTGMKVGDVVAYAGNPMGSYTEEQIIPANVAVPVPHSLDPTIVAAIMLKGMTAQFLVRRCFKVEHGHTVLVHAAAGGVGSLLCQWANALGATVIGTVSSEEKAAQATEDGCHHVIIYTKEDFVTSVNNITSGKGVNVVYDSVGKDTFQANNLLFNSYTWFQETRCIPDGISNRRRLYFPNMFGRKTTCCSIAIHGSRRLGLYQTGSLQCLALRGYLVSFGQSSGSIDPVPLSDLAAKSLFLTRPSLFNYNTTRDELLECSGELFTNVASGILRVRVNHTYPLSEAAQAHAVLETRKTSGSVVLLP